MSMVDAKLLWRDWRGGQLNLIITALVLAVMVVTAVSLLADRVERGLNDQISSFLAADLSLQGGVAIPNQYESQANELGLETARVARFRSMVFFGDASHLASVKAVQNTYPLRGQMELSGETQIERLERVEHGPPAGEVWVEPRLLNLLNIKLGDELEVGYSKLRVSRLISKEPDRGSGFSVAGARVMMSYEDLPGSQLVRPGSQIFYQLLLAGSEPQISSFTQWFEQADIAANGEDGVRHHRLQTPDNAEERLSEALQRGRAFLLLSGTIGVLLAGLAMALASHRYATRLTDQVALMKAWGQSSAAIRRSHLMRLLMITVSATVVGMLLGWAAHYLLLQVARELFDAILPAAGWRPWLVAAITGMVCVMGFALPALWHLPAIAPLRVLRRDLPDDLVSQGKRLIIGIAALLALTLWYSGSVVLALMFLSALFALFAICAIIALQILKLVQQFGNWHGSYVRLGLANLWRRRAQTLVQLVGFSITLMLLLVVVGLRTQLIGEWQAQLPDDAPSHFLFNVASDELEPVKTLLAEQEAQAQHWYPMVRGRLVGLNGEPLTRARLSRAGGLSREVSLTQAALLPEANEIVAGQWWDNDSQASEEFQFSMEIDVANELGVGLGDVIEFSIGGLTFAARLTSLRSVDWQNMTPNFFIIFRPGALDKFAPNWITSVRAKPQQQSGPFVQSAPFVNQIIQQYPTAVVIELGAIIKQIRDVIDRVTQGLEMILLLVLACGALVLFAAIGVSFDERLRENAVLRTLGSSRKIVVGALATEFVALGAIAGLIASIGAEIILYFLQLKVFEMTPLWHPELWILGIVSGVVLITTLGLLRSREIITVPPLQSLRQIA
ncbi:MAG: FtsX-like permease family protein [Gammaproteobacteria bacterium]|nr:FtsX-like permease family protein [Gammaproteobacteria bacterium]